MLMSVSWKSRNKTGIVLGQITWRFSKKILDLLVNLVYQVYAVWKRDCIFCRGIAQLVEHRSPKPRVVSSNLTAPASKKTVREDGFFALGGVRFELTRK